MLASITNKFEKKKAEVDAEIPLQELLSNVQLLEDLANQKITVEVEQALLAERQPEMEEKFKVGIMSNFSLGKLSLPQVS